MKAIKCKRVNKVMHIYDRLQEKILLMAIVLLPFVESLGNRNEGMLGKLGHDGAFYPLLLGVVIWMLHGFIYKEKLSLPKNISFRLMIMMIGWVLFSSLINFNNIVYVAFQGKTGLDRFVLQFFLLVFYCIIPLYIYNVGRKINDIDSFVKKGINIALVLSAIYIALEFGFFFKVSYLSDALIFVNGLFRGDELTYFKIRGLAGEASLFGFWLAFVLPFILSYLFLEKNKKYWLALVVVLLGAVGSYSRTVYVVALVEIFLFLCLFFKEIVSDIKSIIRHLCVVAIMVGFLIIVFGDNVGLLADYDILQIFESLIGTGSEGNIQDFSNAARYGSQWAAWNVFLMAPIFGVGWGQEGFYMVDFFPQWSWISPEVQEWAVNGHGNSLPSAFNVFIRFLACSGFIGALLWGLIWIFECYELIKKHGHDAEVKKGKVIAVVIMGIIFLWGSADQVRFFGMWIALGLSWIYTERVYY